MKPEKIELGDWARMMFGDVPASFYIELIIRTAFVYLLLIIAMRLLGRRMSAQLNKTEMAALVSLAAAIGIPIQAPDRGIIPAIIITILVVIISRSIAYYSFKSQKFERIAQADLSILVEDGCMHMKEMQKIGITRERVLAEIRSEGITHLGKVKRLYMEAGGGFSLVEAPHVVPGLSAIPAIDKDFENELIRKEEVIVCHNCGNNKDKNNQASKCQQCGDTEWVPAVVDKADKESVKLTTP